MIDFKAITKTLDGFDCHYFGTRVSFGKEVHCFGVFSAQIGLQEITYDENGNRLKFEMGSWVESRAANYQIVKPKRKVKVTRWLCFAYRPDFIDDQIVVHALLREPTSDESNHNKYFKIDKHTWTLEVPE